jgi:predicted lipid carrier protein YhbT
MHDSKGPSRFSLVPLLGAAAPPGIERILSPALAVAMRVMHRRHGALFDRLGKYGGRRYLIDPTDLPFSFLLMPRAGDPQAWAIGPSEEPDVDVTIRGSLSTLIALLEGRVDGDALFFSRDLAVEGDTEALLALRNAVDGEGIDLLRDFAMCLGPLAPVGVRLAGVTRVIAATLADRVGSVVASLLGPLDRGLETQARTLKGIESRLEQIEHRMARKRT